MNSTSPLQIGDIVRIIGPNWCDSKEKLGAIFQITEETGHGFSTGGHSWYPATSLRKVRVVDDDELQIGDWVEVTGPDDHGFGHTIGEKFRISLLNRPGAPFPCASDTGRAFYPASSLRKLSHAERGELAGKTIGEAAQEFSDEVEKAKDAIRDILAPSVDDRLKIIEQNMESFHDFQMDQNRGVGERLSAIESKLAGISPKDRQFSPEEIDSRNSPLSKEELEEYWRNQAACGQASPVPWTIDISRGNMHLRNSGRDGGKLGEWAKRKMELDEAIAKLANGIVSQADDAKCLSDIAYFLEKNDQLLPFPNQGLDNAKALIKRYLAAIEGGKP